MTVVRKAISEDFHAIYPLFAEFNNPNLTRNDWQQLFNNCFESDEGFCGYLMEHNGDIVGYIGMLFSKRIIGGIEKKFCNLTGWIVKKEFRSKSLLLLFPALKMTDHVLTDFSPSREAQTILKKIGFNELESIVHISLPVINPFKLFFNKPALFSHTKDIQNELLSFERLNKIFNDHLQFKCKHLLIKTNTGLCYIVYTKVRRKKIPMAQLHFISNPQVFTDYIDAIKFFLIRTHGIFIILIDSRFITKRPSFSIEFKLPIPRMFKSKSLSTREVDGLYSEFIALNL